MKTGLEKTILICESASEFSKDTAEAYLESARTAGKGLQAINKEVFSYSKQAVANSMAVTWAIMGSKSVHEAFALQTNFAKSAFEGYVAQLTKFNELFSATAKGSFGPLQGRAAAFSEVMSSAA